MRFIFQATATGAKAYLFRQYKTLAVLLAVLTMLIILAIDLPRRTYGLTTVGFIVGAWGSMLAGYLGTYVTTRSASRIAQAAATSGISFLACRRRHGAVSRRHRPAPDFGVLLGV